MAKSRGKSSKESDRAHIRQGTLHKIRERYARFGDDVVQYLAEKSSNQLGLRQSLSKILNPLPLEEERMHEALVRFLSLEGPDAFFSRLGIRDSDTPVPGRTKKAPSAKNEDPKLTFLPGSTAPPEPFEAPDHAMPSHTSSLGHGITKSTYMSGDTGIREREKPPSAPAQVQSEPSSPADGPWNGQERRSGRERRSGVDRRSGRDRRQSVEVVFKNRRYGSDRRTSIERRSGHDRRQGRTSSTV